MIALLAWLALLAAPARAQGTILVTTEPGDTCRSIAIRVYGDPDAIDLVHEHNPELGPQPHHLAPGTVLRLPPPGPAAHLTAIERRVERRDPDASAFVEARPGSALARGTQVRTHQASSAEITFRDRAEITVREQTLVIVYGGRRRLVERPITHAELERGALRSRLGELAGDRPLEVETPSSQASLGGEGVVSVEDDGTTASRTTARGRRPWSQEASAWCCPRAPGSSCVAESARPAPARCSRRRGGARTSTASRSAGPGAARRCAAASSR